MARSLLMMPPFWDPVCVPLGLSSLKAYAAQHGHDVTLFDFNTVPEVFGAQQEYFREGKRQFPQWERWNIARNGTEILALHQLVYLYARNRPNYRELVAEVLNMDERPLVEFLAQLDTNRFDSIFNRLYAHIDHILNRLLAEVQPAVVGCTLLNSTWPATAYLLRRVKGLLRGVRTVVGGPGPLLGFMANDEDVQKFLGTYGQIDYYVVGEGERPFLNILENETLPAGLVRQPSEAMAETKEELLGIDELPLPDYGNLDVNRYLQLSLATSRGCPFKCSFCAETVYWDGFRSLGKSRAYRQLDALAQKYGRNSFYLCDSLANQIIHPLTAEISSSGRPYQLDCYLRADRSCTDPKRVKDWHTGGLFRARLGMESASQRILDAMAKMTTPQHMSDSLHALASAGVMTSTLWIIGYPGETDAEFMATLEFIREHRSQIYQADAWLFQYHPEGLADSSTIHRARGSRLRYSDELNDLFAVTPYRVAQDLSAGDRFRRLELFVQTMDELAIPNPYSLYEWISAEQRWKRLGHDSRWDLESNVMALNG